MGRRGHRRPPLRGLNGSNGANTSAARYSSQPLARPQPDNRGVVETWDSFGVVVGAASGALIALLFVAISVNASRIAKHPALPRNPGSLAHIHETRAVVETAMSVLNRVEHGDLRAADAKQELLVLLELESTN